MQQLTENNKYSIEWINNSNYIIVYIIYGNNNNICSRYIMYNSSMFVYYLHGRQSLK